MESGWNIWVWLVGVVSRRWVWLVGVGESMGVVSRKWVWVWVESMGMASGCGCKELYRFPHITYPYSSLFCSSIPTFCSFLKMFFCSCSITFW